MATPRSSWKRNRLTQAQNGRGMSGHLHSYYVCSRGLGDEHLYSSYCFFEGWGHVHPLLSLRGPNVKKRKREGWPPPFVLFFLKRVGGLPHPFFCLLFRGLGGGRPHAKEKEKRQGWPPPSLLLFFGERWGGHPLHDLRTNDRYTYIYIYLFIYTYIYIYIHTYMCVYI
jgi:hypothetical protein